MKDEALERRRRVCARGGGKREWPELAGDEHLRDDPRFQKLLLGLR